MTRVLRVALVLVACACGRPSQDGAPGTAPSAASASAASTAVASAAPPASSAAKTAAPQAWKGSYKTSPGSLTVPPELAKTHWSSSDTTAGVGEGTMQLTIDPASHRVTGTLDGAVGAAVVEGLLGDGQLSAAVRRKDPTDKGFAGTLLATVSADKVTGTLSLASGDGATLRSGTFTLSPDGH